MAEIGLELRTAWRRLVSAPLFTCFCIVTLALGIGATTAIYSVVYAAVLRPPSIPDVDRVANLYNRDPRRGGSVPMLALAYADFADYRAEQRSFEHLAAWARFQQQPLSGGGTATTISGEMVGGEYFSVMRVDAALGRVLQPADDRPGAQNVTVLSDGLWRRSFGADPDVVGRTVRLAGEPYDVVGVAPPSFRGGDMPNVLPTAAWIPLSAGLRLNNITTGDRQRRTLFARGRLQAGRTMGQAFAEFRAIGDRLDLEYPPPEGPVPFLDREWFLMPAAEVRLHESVDFVAVPLATAITVAVGLVLLVACTNIANLMLVRGTSRRHEQAVRLALGASRGDLVRAQVIEAGLVTGGGAALAFLVAKGLMVTVLSGSVRLGPGISAALSPELNLPVAMVAALCAMASLLVFGVVPALHAARTPVRDAVASNAQGAPLTRWRGRRNLIAVQVGVSTALVAIAVLCAQQVISDARHDPGMDLERIGLVQVDFDRHGRDEAHARRVLEEVVRRASLEPGIQSVALASGLPAGLITPCAAVARDQSEVTDGRLRGGAGVELMASTPDIFRVLGVQITAGAGFDERHTPAGEPVAVLSQDLADRLFPGETAVGRQVAMQRSQWSGDETWPIETVTVIGIAASTDTRVIGRRATGGTIYLPFAQHYEPAMAVVARAADPGALPERLRRMMQQVDPDLALMDAGTGPVVTRSENLLMQVGAVGAGLLGGLALLLAMVGLYGVVAELVLRRTREIGIRMAVGADARRVMRMVLADGLRPVVEGLVLGVAVAGIAWLAIGRAIVLILPEVDATALLLLPALFLGVGLLALWLPASRAARVDPNVALRHL